MNATVHSYHFDFSPSIIRFLGEELIHDKKIAIADLPENDDAAAGAAGAGAGGMGGMGGMM